MRLLNKHRWLLLAAAILFVSAVLLAACDDASQSDEPASTAIQLPATAIATHTAIPSPTSVPSPAATSVSDESPEDEREFKPPCESTDGSNPCSSRSLPSATLFTLPSGGAAYGYQPETPSAEELLEMGRLAAGLSPTHLAIRATPSNESIRCDWRGSARTLDQREREIRFWLGLAEEESLPSVAEVEREFMDTMSDSALSFIATRRAQFRAIAHGGLSTEFGDLHCYVDYVVHEYLLGDGPGTITVAFNGLGQVRSYSLYKQAHADYAFGGRELLSEGAYDAYLLQLAGDTEFIVGSVLDDRESVVFLVPAGAYHAIAVEVWQAVALWDLQIAEDGTTINAIRPGLGERDPEHTQSLANLQNRIATAAQSDAFADRRIPDVGGLRSYYEDIGAYSDITPDDGSDDPFEPEEPPPVPLCAKGGAIADSLSARNLVYDCGTLLEARDSLRGDDELNWEFETPVGEWYGVGTGNSPELAEKPQDWAQWGLWLAVDSLGDADTERSWERVTSLQLANEGLSGTISPMLGRLWALRRLDLSGNSLTGTIPRELGLLENLEELKLAGNSLTGCIPVALQEIPNNDLDELNLTYCRPAAPQGLDFVTLTETSIQLVWDKVAGASKYRVERQRPGTETWIIDSEDIVDTMYLVEDFSCMTRWFHFRVGAYGSGTQYNAEWSDPSAVKSAGLDLSECVP